MGCEWCAKAGGQQTGGATYEMCGKKRQRCTWEGRAGMQRWKGGVGVVGAGVKNRRGLVRLRGGTLR